MCWLLQFRARGIYKNEEIDPIYDIDLIQKYLHIQKHKALPFLREIRVTYMFVYSLSI